MAEVKSMLIYERYLRSFIGSKFFWLVTALVCILILIQTMNSSNPAQLQISDGVQVLPKVIPPTSETCISSHGTNRAEVRHIAYLKTHKTGSSTTQNIFLRFGVFRNLTFLLGSVENNECGGFPHCISYYDTLTEKNTWPPPENKKFEIMCSHVIYNRNSFQKYLPTDTANIGIVREPVTRLESAINFFKLLQNTPLSEYANDPVKYDHVMSNNRMAFEFGFDKQLFPNKINKTLTDKVRQEASRYINQLKSDFTLIVVMERYPESIVLMKRLLHWTTRDILYRETGALNHGSFQKNDTQKLKSYLYLDYMLYEFALKELDRKIAIEGEGFMDEVRAFIRVNKLVNEYCNRKEPAPLNIKPSELNDAVCVDQDFCVKLKTNEIPFTKQIRSRQYGKQRGS